MEVYTDGSCITGSDGVRYAGFGVWFGNGDTRNTSVPIVSERATNQYAELISIKYALKLCRDVKDLTLYTDSQYSINCITLWYKTWIKNGWKSSSGSDVLYSDIIKECLRILEYRIHHHYKTNIQHVKGHSGIIGNDAADVLATRASVLSQSLAMKNTVFFSNGIFSQFWPSKFKSNINKGLIEYNCAEQWHHHRKALLFQDTEIAEKIMLETRPYIQKSLGRQVKGFDQDTWIREGPKIAFEGNYYKFSQDKSLKVYLLSTRSKRLVEARDDSIWGIGITVNQAKMGVKWNGLNLLGKALMDVRTRLIDECEQS